MVAFTSPITYQQPVPPTIYTFTDLSTIAVRQYFKRVYKHIAKMHLWHSRKLMGFEWIWVLTLSEWSCALPASHTREFQFRLLGLTYYLVVSSKLERVVGSGPFHLKMEERPPPVGYYIISSVSFRIQSYSELFVNGILLIENIRIMLRCNRFPQSITPHLLACRIRRSVQEPLGNDNNDTIDAANPSTSAAGKY